MDRKQRNIAILLTTLAVVIGLSAVLSELFNTSRDLVSITTWTPDRWTAAPRTIVPVTPTEILSTPTSVLQSPTPTTKRTNACVYPLAYWVYHREIWPAQIAFKGFRFTHETAMSVLIDPTNEGSTGLLKEFIVTNLNISRGVDPSPLGLTLGYAEDWLNLHPEGSEVLEEDLQVGMSLQSTLEQFNNGELGTILCSDALDIPTLPPPTPTKTYTPTPRRTVIYIPPRATATEKPGGEGPAPTKVPPTKAPPTSVPPTNPPTQPPPSNTPVPADTEVPTPTLAPPG